MNLVSIKELSDFLKVKPSTIYSWVHSGTIPFIKLNGLLRFDIGEITKWVENSKPKPPRLRLLLKKQPIWT
ncbi:MAG: helix-turn-helix domain-containing protein [Deltaproteobacteria bacterium]|nr:helix-turn-helix domain-containing protein [Deltaproteobacteria bacterium]